jgi:hypothetical protein
VSLNETEWAVCVTSYKGTNSVCGSPPPRPNRLPTAQPPKTITLCPPNVWGTQTLALILKPSSQLHFQENPTEHSSHVW